MNKLTIKLLDFMGENIVLIIMMAAIFFSLQYFHSQESQQLVDLVKQAEIIKFKLALLMEKGA
ncbi:hypothetical protein [Pseudoalteromonas sp. SA25]|uniref:hypothetical protein n=1 Tax=Pseudoalteromonas sp. SA25 TaxID=2686347 RepID=UPI0013FDB59B|nr:hypothetical protein [Pseudoalteromonas sp. SA25]